jgi:hypothetical protein
MQELVVRAFFCTNIGEILRINAGCFCWDFQQNTAYGSITRARGTLAACPVCKIGSYVNNVARYLGLQFPTHLPEGP